MRLTIAITGVLLGLVTACGSSSSPANTDPTSGGSDGDGASSGDAPGDASGDAPGDSSDDGVSGDGGDAGGETFVVGYLPDYQWDALPPASVPWSRISMLTLGMLWPMPDGQGGYTLGQNNWETRVADPIDDAWASSARAYARAAHEQGAKLACALGGAGGNPNPSGTPGQDLFTLATDTDAHAAAFAANIKRVLQGLGFDGVDLDWEDGAQDPAIMFAGLVRLAHQLRIAWPEATIIIPTGPLGDDATGLAGAKDDVDAFMPMTYLDLEQWGGIVLPSPLTPLFAAPSGVYSVDQVLTKWRAAGVPASKLLMGVGGFGSVWGDSNGDGQAPNVPYANASSPTAVPNGEERSLCNDNCVTQTWLDDTLAAHPELVEGWDETTQSSYWSAPAPNRLVNVSDPRNPGQSVSIGVVFFESPKSIRAKAQYVRDQGLKGLSFWTIAQLVHGAKAPVLDAIP